MNFTYSINFHHNILYSVPDKILLWALDRLLKNDVSCVLFFVSKKKWNCKVNYNFSVKLVTFAVLLTAATVTSHTKRLNCDLQCVVSHLASHGIYDEFLKTVEYRKGQPHCIDVITKLRYYFFADARLFRGSKNFKIYDCIEQNFIAAKAQENYLHLHAVKEIGIGWRIWRYWSYHEKTQNLHETIAEAMKRIESHCNQFNRNQIERNDYERHFWVNKHTIHNLLITHIAWYW